MVRITVQARDVKEGLSQLISGYFPSIQAADFSFRPVLPPCQSWLVSASPRFSFHYSLLIENAGKTGTIVPTAVLRRAFATLPTLGTSFTRLNFGPAHGPPLMAARRGKRTLGRAPQVSAPPITELCGVPVAPA
ncbi:unnamed protein product [Bursaphelenchus xylophilus]|uniref:(pine wood nematode) hypothetical protein n=1 Tax=Bursaphelenchus xylophilus TaxID=6326 RepID=A0A7I8XN88_BURXY|nr:unnamed protein product [Bursaphelenchus xylophilus]CAG9089303.1 unnamed protein product [Bursaphelenchus xylophilus]